MVSGIPAKGIGLLAKPCWRDCQNCNLPYWMTILGKCKNKFKNLAHFVLRGLSAKMFRPTGKTFSEELSKLNSECPEQSSYEKTSLRKSFFIVFGLRAIYLRWGFSKFFLSVQTKYWVDLLWIKFFSSIYHFVGRVVLLLAEIFWTVAKTAFYRPKKNFEDKRVLLEGSVIFFRHSHFQQINFGLLAEKSRQGCKNWILRHWRNVFKNVLFSRKKFLHRFKGFCKKLDFYRVFWSGFSKLQTTFPGENFFWKWKFFWNRTTIFIFFGPPAGIFRHIGELISVGLSKLNSVCA